MMQSQRRSPWQLPLGREIALILLIKLLLLLGIRFYWFSAPTVPPDGATRTAERLLGQAAPAAPVPTVNQEMPR